jgi:hypothetical protein
MKSNQVVSGFPQKKSGRNAKLWEASHRDCLLGYYSQHKIPSLSFVLI